MCAHAQAEGGGADGRARAPDERDSQRHACHQDVLLGEDVCRLGSQSSQVGAVVLRHDVTSCVW